MNECRCIDCIHCDLSNNLCILKNEIYELNDDDLWIYEPCEFFEERDKENS